MINGKRILAVTLARGGSKAVPKKNILPVAGKPLVAYTIQEVKKSKLVDDYIISTDSAEIAGVCRSLGAEVPFLRPAEFATDEAPSQDALYHAVTEYEKVTGRRYDYIIEAMCTNPLKLALDIDACLEKLDATGADSVVSVMRLFDHHPARIKKIVDDEVVDFAVPEDERARRQDFRPEAYIRNGSLYALKRETLLVHHSKRGKVCRPYLMPADRSVNIDEPMDVFAAEYMLRKHTL